MKQLVDWYWTHGIKRGFDPNDPDREIRKVSIGGWLDPVARIIDRNFDILGVDRVERFRQAIILLLAGGVGKEVYLSVRI